jgi:hypothetical protein
MNSITNITVQLVSYPKPTVEWHAYTGRGWTKKANSNTIFTNTSPSCVFVFTNLNKETIANLEQSFQTKNTVRHLTLGYQCYI